MQHSKSPLRDTYADDKNDLIDLFENRENDQAYCRWRLPGCYDYDPSAIMFPYCVTYCAAMLTCVREVPERQMYQPYICCCCADVAPPSFSFKRAQKISGGAPRSENMHA